MNAPRAALLTIALAVLAAETVRPTTYQPKRISGTSLLGIRQNVRLDSDELEDLPPIVQPAIGNIDVARIVAGGRSRELGVGALKPSESVELLGWCGDPQAVAPGSYLLAIVDGRHRIDVTSGYGLLRPDVARVFQSPAMSRSGFDISLSGARLGSGRHEIAVAVVARDGRGIFVFPIKERVEVSS